MNDLSLKKGILINFAAKYSNVIIQIILTSILARLLTPKEYGVIAIVMIFITFFNLLGDMGIGPAIIQYKDLTDDEISSIFIFTFFSSLLVGFCFFVVSYFIAYAYNNTIYIPVGHLLCFTIILNLLIIVPNGLLLREKQFKIIGVSTVITNIIAGITTVILAYKGFSYYALVINSILQSFLNFLIMFYYSKIKIKIKNFSIKPVKKISKFSIYQLLFNFINYFSRNLDNLLIGKYIGINALGYYDKAYKLMLYPVQNLTFVITPVLQPILSDYQNEKNVVLTYYKKIVKFLAIIGAFVTIFCFFSSKEIILIMFGNQWLGSVGAFKFLSISIVIQIVLSSSGAIFQATDNTKYLFISGLLSAIVMITLIIIGLIIGKIEYIAALLALGFIINFFQAYYILIKKVFKESFLEFLNEFMSTIIITVIMITFYLILRFNISNILISLVFKLVVGCFGFVVGLLITKEYLFLKNALFKKKI